MDRTTCRQGRRSSMERSLPLSWTHPHQDVNPMVIQRRTKQNEPTENGEGPQKVRLGSHATEFVYRMCLPQFGIGPDVNLELTGGANGTNTNTATTGTPQFEVGRRVLELAIKYVF
jgi:hypothetical protein